MKTSEKIRDRIDRYLGFSSRSGVSGDQTDLGLIGFAIAMVLAGLLSIGYLAVLAAEGIASTVKKK